MTKALIVGLAAVTLALPQSSQPTPNAIRLAGSGYRIPPVALEAAPGQLLVLHVYGVAADIPAPIAAVPDNTGFPHQLAGVSVDLVQGKPASATSLELRAIQQAHCKQPCSPITVITLQMPFELDTTFQDNERVQPSLRISENGTVIGSLWVRPVSDNLHVINTCDDSQIYISAAYTVPRSICAHVVMGNQAMISLYNLAHGGQDLSMWVYGMGATAAPDAQGISKPVQTFQVSFDFRPNAPASPVASGSSAVQAVSAYVGTPYQVNFKVPPVPAGLPACDGVTVKSNLTVTLTGPNSYDAAQICVAP